MKFSFCSHVYGDLSSSLGGNFFGWGIFDKLYFLGYWCIWKNILLSLSTGALPDYHYFFIVELTWLYAKLGYYIELVLNYL